MGMAESFTFVFFKEELGVSLTMIGKLWNNNCLIQSISYIYYYYALDRTNAGDSNGSFKFECNEQISIAQNKAMLTLFLEFCLHLILMNI